MHKIFVNLTSPPILQQAPLQRQRSVEVRRLREDYETTLSRWFYFSLEGHTDTRYGARVQLDVRSGTREEYIRGDQVWQT